MVVLLNGALFAAAYRFARGRGTRGIVQAICDAFLIYFLVEYAAVAVPGALGVFTWWAMSLIAAAASAALWIGAGRQRPITEAAVRRGWDGDCFGLLASALFTAGFLGAYAWLQRWAPPMATDSLVYHLPTVIQWIQTHRLGIYPTWYWNPAASYSPATGMTFMAWLMAPARNDVFVRFVQCPPLMWIFFLAVRLCRQMGCTRTAAGLIATALVLSRSLFSEALIPKDDLFVTAFVAAAVLALGREQLRERLGPWRVGIAMGFVLASKYTVLLVCPVFLFLLDSPFRAGWRRRDWVIAVLIVLLMAAPWYVRNILLTGNPLYPVDIHLLGIRIQGLFGTERDQQLRTPGGFWRMLSQTYHSLPAALIVLLVVGWIGAWAAGGRSIVRDPLRRACVLGSVVTLLVFLVTSPHHEVRYMFPLFVLWFADLGLALSKWVRNGTTQGAVCVIPAAVAAATSFDRAFASHIATFSAVGLVVAVIGAAFLWLQLRVLHLSRQRLGLLGGLAIVLPALAAYVNWHAYVSEYLGERPFLWQEFQYPRQGPLWRFVAEQVPADATIAYANTYFVYPLYDPTYLRRVGYAPVRRGLHNFLHLPRLADRVPGDLIFDFMAADMNADPDPATWIENLRALGATHLVVNKREIVSDPPEFRLARAEPRMFVKVYEDDEGVVFRVVWPPF